MVRAKRLTLLVLALALLPWSASGDEGKVKEPATGVEFPASRDGMQLMGVGVRKKLVFNVYAAALYLSGDDFKAGLKDSTAKEIYKVVRYGSFKKLMVLHFVRDVPADKVREAFGEALRANMPDADWEAEKDRVDAFLAGCVDVKSGQAYELRTQGAKLKLSLGSKILFEAESKALAAGMWGSWFGAHPISESLRDELVSRADKVLGD